MSDTNAMCATHKAIDLISSKWVLVILYNLCSSPKGFNELQRLVAGISPRILSLRMKDLADYGLVSKKIMPTTPPQTEYRLTAKGESLKSVIQQFADWAATA